MQINNIIFCKPSRIIGGSEYLFVRCAQYLRENGSYRIGYIDYADGMIRKDLKDYDDILFVEYKDGCITTVPEHSALILQLNNLSNFESMYQVNRKNTVILFWCLHTLNIIHQVKAKSFYFLSRLERKKLGQEFARLIDCNVVKFMSIDSLCKNQKTFMFESNNHEWLPNPIVFRGMPPTFDKEYKVANNPLSFMWLGRLDTEKAVTLKTLMNEIEVLAKEQPVVLYVIGDGEAREDLELYAQSKDYKTVFEGQKTLEELDEIVNCADIGLASGTSVFEFVVRYKPIIIKDFLHRIYQAGELRDYFLSYEVDDCMVKDNVVIRYAQAGFIDKVHQILANYDKNIRLNYDYVANHHTISNTCSKLEQCVTQLSEQNWIEVYNVIDRMSAMINKGKNRIETVVSLKSYLFSFLKKNKK